MQQNNRIIGFSKHNGVDYTFEFDKSNNVLYLYNHTITSIKEQEIHWFKNYPINNDYQIIYGILPDKTEIMFKTIGMPGCQKGFYSYNVIWYFYFQGLNISNTGINRISISGTEIDLFYPPNQTLTFTHSFENNRPSFIVKADPIFNTIGCLKIDDVELKISFGNSISENFNSNCPLKVSSVMIIDFSKSLSPEFVVKIIQAVYRFLSFIVYRRNIVIDSITTNTMNSDPNDQIVGGNFYMSTSLNKENEIKYQPRKNITYFELNNKTLDILEACYRQQLPLDHLCDNNASKSLYSTERIFNILRSFDKVSREYFKYLNPNKVSYEKKLTDAFNTCHNLLEDHINSNFSDKYSHVRKDIINSVKEIRNNIAHYYDAYDLQKIDLRHIIVIEALIYALWLKKFDINENTIKNIIHYFFY